MKIKDPTERKKVFVLNTSLIFVFAAFVAGALTAYDLPDLVGCVAPRRVALVGTKDQMNQLASQRMITKELEFPRAVFASKNLSRNLRVTSEESIETTIDWCFSD